MNEFQTIEGGVTAPLGFRACGVEAHVKYASRKDFALIVSDIPAACAGMFTTNAVAAAPVRLCRSRVASGKLQAIAVNTGFANACTGKTGEENAAETARIVAEALSIPSSLVAVCSTGVIGVNLPMDRIADGVRLAVPALSRDGAADASRAIMTTDTVPKSAARLISVGGREVRIGGMCKGAGMIEPYMATMLAFITTDVSIPPDLLDAALRNAVDSSFNRIVIDNDRSTNDTAMVMANGLSGAEIASADSEEFKLFSAALSDLCLDLARQMVMDGEGVSKFVTLTVSGAAHDADAQLAARAIARSMLCKTSWYGTDPNWGRVIAAAGYSGAKVAEELTRIRYGNMTVFDRGRVADASLLAQVKELMRGRAFEVGVDLGIGSGSCTLYTGDLTHEYVNINADYTT